MDGHAFLAAANVYASSGRNCPAMSLSSSQVETRIHVLPSLEAASIFLEVACSGQQTR